MKFRPLGMTVVHADGYTEKTNMLVAFSIYFANAHKNVSNNKNNLPAVMWKQSNRAQKVEFSHDYKS
jgi:hypothetical protein